MAKQTRAEPLSDRRRLRYALYASWEIEALTQGVRQATEQIICNPGTHESFFTIKVLTDRMLEVSRALLNAAQPGEGTVAELERVLAYPPHFDSEAGHG